MPKKETKKVGRPSLQKGKAKNAVLQIRFSESEKALLEKKAKKQGLTLSEWARQTLKTCIE